MNRGEEIEYLPETTDAAAHHDRASVNPAERRSGLTPTWLAIALLAVLAGLATVGVARVGQLKDRTDSLILEQQRATCYQRLQWLGDQYANHPERDALRAGAARSCEGETPLIAFEDE